jgi:hypothetical protein
MPEVTAARTEQIAHALGVAGAAQPLDGSSGGVAGYLVGSALDCKRMAADDACGASFVMWTSGWFTYQAGTYDDGSGTAPSDDAAKAAATAWISLSGVTNGDSYDLTIQPPPVIPDKPDGVPGDKTAPAFAQVIAQPTGHSGADNGPAIYVSVASDGSIANVGGFWAHIVAESNYTLHNSGQLLADLQAMRGTFATLETEFGDVSGADVTQDAVADIAGVSLEYRPAAPTGDESPDQVYLVPVYVLKATLTQDGQSTDGLSTNAEACSSRGSEPCGYSFGFATWIPATGPAR